MLTDRGCRVLGSLIQEYIATGIPVASERIARKGGLGVSSATIRNEMAQLEEEGYICQPHTSAGRVPSAKGYRYYVELLLVEQELSPDEQLLIRHQFYQTGKGVDESIRLAATILSRMLRCAAIVTWPAFVHHRLRLLEMVSLRERVALLIVVLDGAKFREQVIDTDAYASQEELSTIARKLTALWEGLTEREIRARKDELLPDEEQIAAAVMDMMVQGSEQEEPYWSGLSQVLSRPEFANSTMVQALVQVIEEGNLLRSILSQARGSAGLRAVIGSDDAGSAMRDLSIVMGAYGLSPQASGVIGVLGPTRMPYGRAFAAVRFLSGAMSELLHQRYL